LLHNINMLAALAITFIAIFSSLQTNARPLSACPIAAQILAQEKKLTAISHCEANHVSGLKNNELFTQVVTEGSGDSITSAVVNTTTKQVVAAPHAGDWYYSAQNKNWNSLLEKTMMSYAQMLRAKRDEVASFTVKCEPDDKETPVVSLAKSENEYVWQLKFLRPHLCSLYERSEVPTYGIADVRLKASTLRTKPGSDEIDFDGFNVAMLPRQNYYEFQGRESYLTWLSYQPKSHCDEKSTLESPRVAITALFNKNDDNSNHRKPQAIKIINADALKKYILETAGAKKPARLRLEGQVNGDTGYLIGAWQISFADELENLVYFGYSDREYRVVAYDLECGKEYASEWFHP
jgi:hypothetical protein